jgi:diguanylate cyclase (GGDEF)-like protein
MRTATGTADPTAIGSSSPPAAISAIPRGRVDLGSVAPSRADWHRGELPIVAGLAVLAVGMAWTAPSVVRVSGAIGLLAMAAAIVLDRDPAVVRGRVVAAIGLTVLMLADAGLPAIDATGDVLPETVWRPLAAIVAYPVLGRALLLTVGRYRLFKSSDLLVEAALIGAAGAIALQVTVNRLSSSAGWEPAASVLTSLLVGLDIALAVVVVRPLTTVAARRGPVIVVGASVTALLLGHLVSAIQLASGSSPGLLATTPIAAALLAIGGGCLYDSISDRPTIIPVEAPLFSGVHAGVVVVAVVAAPAVLASQVLWDVSVSGAVAVGAGLIGTVLAVHIVILLQERADSEHQASHDDLTGLPNRLLFTDRLERAIAHAERNDMPVGVLYIDLDRFKDVNDTFGHEAGDQLLREVASRLAECARHEDTVARLSGDEFAVLLPHLRSADDVAVVAGRILEAMREPVAVADVEIASIGSIGVAVYPHDGTHPADLLNAADAAMYRAKDQGGAAVEMFSAELHEQAATRLELETALQHAIAHDELVLYYQPIVEAGSGRTCGAEALVRWIHPERGMIPPNDFIPVAEQSNLIIELGNWVIQTACNQLADWARQGLGDRFVAINVSPRHFRDDLATSIARALRETGVNPDRLVVELTETAAADDVAQVAERLGELRQIGVKAAIDDFGTGYCGLQYLGELPVSTLKLDRSFVQAMTPSSAAIVAATIAMSRTLGLTMVAEGVETEEQRRFLESQGCDRLQGYHLGRPMPAEEFAERIRSEDLAAVPRPPAVPSPSGVPTVPAQTHLTPQR